VRSKLDSYVRLRHEPTSHHFSFRSEPYHTFASIPNKFQFQASLNYPNLSQCPKCIPYSESFPTRSTSTSQPSSPFSIKSASVPSFSIPSMEIPGKGSPSCSTSFFSTCKAEAVIQTGSTLTICKCSSGGKEEWKESRKESIFGLSLS
jgi:hypothetical protein